MPTSLDPLPGDDEIECARCGAIFYYELTRCPNCGVNIYEPDDDAPRQSRGTFKSHPQGLSVKLGNLFRRLIGQPHPAEELFNQSMRQAGLYNDLLTRVGGNRNTIERLIEYERQRLPGGTRTRWLENALHRWEKDNGL